MAITYYENVIQGTDEWFEMRRGILTASQMKYILTPKLKISESQASKIHLYELLAQRISKFVEPSYVGDDMLRGYDDEIRARMAYSEKYMPVDEVGFITNDEFGYTLGFSPDGLVGEDGLIEVKSRIQKHHVKTILSEGIPEEYVLQVQFGLLVTGRKWCDFISYCGGLPMYTVRVTPDHKVQEAILRASQAVYKEMTELEKEYYAKIQINPDRFIETERVIEEEITI
jgi:hypothetical protein